MSRGRGAETMSRGLPSARALSIAGSDSGGGAGIQADLKAFARCGVHGASVITAVTSQNTVSVSGCHVVPPSAIAAQIAAVFGDIGADAVKIGMLADAATVDAVADALAALPVGVPVVIDPVLAASSGATLAEPAATARLVERLFPRADVITPNLAEARALSGCGPDAGDVALLHALAELGPGAVLLTGGHRAEPADLLLRPDGMVEAIPFERLGADASHGSGCTHSSALAARLALGDELPAAARRAQQLTAEAIRDGFRDVGAGAGPVNVLGALIPAQPRRAR